MGLAVDAGRDRFQLGAAACHRVDLPRERRARTHGSPPPARTARVPHRGLTSGTALGPARLRGGWGTWAWPSTRAVTASSLGLPPVIELTCLGSGERARTVRRRRRGLPGSPAGG